MNIFKIFSWVIIFLLLYEGVSFSQTESKELKEKRRKTIEQFVQKINNISKLKDWKIRSRKAYDFLWDTQTKLTSLVFSNSEEILASLWKLFLVERDFLQKNKKIQISSEGKDYDRYFRRLVKLITFNKKRNVNYKFHKYLLDIPLWETTIIRVIENEGGEDILPQLLNKLADKTYLRAGIIAITYRCITKGKYSEENIEILKNTYIEHLNEALNRNDSISVKSGIRIQAITGLGVIGDEDVLPYITPFLNDTYYKKTRYDPNTGLRMDKEIKYYPVREAAEKVIEVLEAGKKLTYEDVVPQCNED